MLTWLEEMGINLVLSLLHQFVKNPEKQQAMKALMLSVADDIYCSYGLAPVQHD
jgi:hypothetical protein